MVRAMIYKHKNIRRIDSVFNSAEFLKAREMVFKKTDLKIFSFIRMT